MKNKQRTNLYQKILIIFFIGAIVGYLYEVIFYYFTEHRLDNAGILFGPWLPIYGFGAVFISLIAPKVKKHPLLLFFGCMLVTGILEYIVGFISVNVFDKKLWDYSGLFLNINGYVCLRSVLTFAIGGLFLVYIVEPFITKLQQNKKYYKYLHNILIIITIIFILDFLISRILKHTPFLY